MNTEIERMLDEQYRVTLEEVAQAKTSSEEAEWQLKKLAELHKQRVAEEKTLNETYIQESELVLKKEAAKESKKDRIIKTVLDAAAILVPTGLSCYWMAKSLKFEETGTFTSRAGQFVSNHFKLFKK